MKNQSRSDLSLAQRWVLAIRPKTLTAAVAPVIVGWGVAHTTGYFHWGAALVAMFVSIMIQIGTNLVNDVVDFSKGADTEARTGPLASPKQACSPPGRFGQASSSLLVLPFLPGFILPGSPDGPCLSSVRCVCFPGLATQPAHSLWLTMDWETFLYCFSLVSPQLSEQSLLSARRFRLSPGLQPWQPVCSPSTFSSSTTFGISKPTGPPGEKTSPWCLAARQRNGNLP